MRVARRLLITIACLLVLGVSASHAAPRWEESSESGQEIDVPLPRLRPMRLRQQWRPSPTGYDNERIHRFWRRYRPVRPEKPAKNQRPEEYLD